MANDFYTEQPVTTENWTSDSKGFKTADYGSLAEGLGDALQMGVKAADNYNQGMIKEEVNKASRKLQDDYGLSSAVDVQAGVDSRTTPKEISDATKRLALLKSAAIAGTLKSSSYWSQAELYSRQLKMRYPGYWEHIDDAFSKILGGKPANRLTAELEQERSQAASEAKQAADKALQERTNALHAARQAGIQEVFMDEAQGKKWSTDAINLAVANRQNLEFKQQTQLRQYELNKKNGEATETEALKTFRTETNHTLATSLGDITSVLGKSKKEYETLVSQANAQRESGQAVDPQLEQKIGAAATAFTSAFNDRMNNLSLKYSQDIPGEKIQNELNIYKDYLKRITSAVQDKDTVVTGHAVELFQAMKNADAATVLLKPGNDAIRRDAAIMQIMPPDVYRDFKASEFNQPWRTSLDRLYVSNITNSNLLERSPVLKGINELREAGVKTPQAYNNYLTNVLNAGTNPSMPPQVKENALTAIYGIENMEFLWKPETVKPQERHPLFLKLSSPSKLKEVKNAFEKGEVSPQTYEAVQNWVTTNGMRLLQQEAATINNINTSRKGLEISFNPKTNYVEVKEKPFESQGRTVVSRAAGSLAEKWMVSEGRDSVNRVNGILRNMKALVDMTGDDPDTLIPAIIGNSGIMIEEPKPVKETTAESVVKAVEDYFIKLNDNNPELKGAKEWEAQLRAQEKSRSKISKELDGVLNKAIKNQEDKSSVMKVIQDIIDGIVQGNIVSD